MVRILVGKQIFYNSFGGKLVRACLALEALTLPSACFGLHLMGESSMMLPVGGC